MAKRTAAIEIRPALEPVPPEAILIDRAERLMRDLATVLGEIKATLPRPTNRQRPNAKRLIQQFGELKPNGGRS